MEFSCRLQVPSRPASRPSSLQSRPSQSMHAAPMMKFVSVWLLEEDLVRHFCHVFGQTRVILAESLAKRWSQFDPVRRRVFVVDANDQDDLKGGRVKTRRRVLELLRQNSGLTLAD